MSVLPIKTKQRLISGLKKFQPILSMAKAKDINESDTVAIVMDMLSEVFGFDKYSEITSEFAIKKNYCDLAIKIDGKVRFLIEVKAIGLDLKGDHVKQSVDYGANAGVDWVLLTNGIYWKVFKIIFGKPVMNELVYEFDLLSLSPKKQSDLDLLYYVARESLGKSVLEDFHVRKQALNKFFIGQIILSEPIVHAIRSTIRKITLERKIESEDILHILTTEVLKREILEGEKAIEAKKKIAKSLKALNPPKKPSKEE